MKTFSQWLENFLEGSLKVNLLINQEEALAAFELMEGPEWLSYNMRVSERNTIKGALEWLESRGGSLTGKPGDYEFDLFPESTFIIYGSGGFNRYYVKTNGDVRFSAGHAIYPSKKTIQNAKNLGFDVFG